MQFECSENRMCVTIKFNKRCDVAALPQHTAVSLWLTVGRTKYPGGYAS